MRARALAVVALAFVVGLVPATAYAADGDVTVSLDGLTFSSDVTTPLFDPTLRVVPGDTVTEDLWVRNSSTTDARVRLDVLDARADAPLFAAALTLGARAVDATGREIPVTVADVGACSVVLRDVALRAGETVRLAVTATVGDLERQDGTRATASFRLRAVATDATVPGPSDPGECGEGEPSPSEGPTEGPTTTPPPTDGPTTTPTDGPTVTPTERPTVTPTAAPTTTPDDDDLPTTGASPTLALGFATALVVSGLLVLALRRRSEEQDDRA